MALMVLLMATAPAQERPACCIFPYRCPTAARLSPQVGQRGTRVTLLLQGARLEQIEDVLFYGPGLKYVSFAPVDQVPDDNSQQQKSTPPGTAAALTLDIAGDCPLGEHLLRIRTRDELSEMVSFWVSPLPCVAETHLGHDAPGNSNGERELAQPVRLGTSVYGYHPGYSTIDHDYYAVTLQQGQRLTLEVWSACLGFQHFRAMSDIAVTVYDPEGNKVAFADDSSLRDMDPVLCFTAPQSGTYFVNIHQNMDFEDGLRHYVAHFSDAPRPVITYPLGGPAGTTLTATAIGDVGGPRQIRIPLPAAPGDFEKSVIPHETPGAVIPNPIRVATSAFPSLPPSRGQPEQPVGEVATFANVLEDGNAHFRPETAQVYSGALPVAFNGRIEHEGQTDWFRFTANKGERYRLRTWAASLGSSLDATVQVKPAAGTQSRVHLSADDSRWIDRDMWGKDTRWFVKDRMDPIAVFEPDADGDYLLGISDAQRLCGPEYVYRVELQPLRDHAFVYFPTDYREAPNKRDRLVIPRGNTIEHTLAIMPATGCRYRGGIRIEAVGLPDGVTFSCPELKPGQTLTQATLTASPEAKSWCGLIDLRLKPTDPRARFSGSYVHNVPATQRRGGYNIVFNRTRRCAVAVVDEAPLRVRVKQPQLGLAQNAMIDLEVEVERRPGFTGAVRVFAAWTPPGVTVSVPLIIPPGENRGVYRLQSSERAEPGTYPVTLTAHEDEGGDQTWGTGFHFVASPAIDLQVVRPYLDVQLARTALERLKTGTIEARIRTISPLPGKATARLVRLPRGVELVQPVTISPGDTQAAFSVRVTKDCLTGLYKEIGCEISIETQGQTITQQTGNGTLRVDVERN